MVYLIIRVTVKDFDTWKPMFDQGQALRQAAGSKGSTVLRSTEDPNQVTVILRWDSEEKARAFSASMELREARERAGVISEPISFFLEEISETAA